MKEHKLEEYYYYRDGIHMVQHKVDGKITCDRPVYPKRNVEDLKNLEYTKGVNSDKRDSKSH